MSENVSVEWDYECPQYCDFNSAELWTNDTKIDSFFEIDHESDRKQSTYSDKHPLVVMSHDTQENGLNKTTESDHNYLTPDKDYKTPDKENLIQDDADNEVFHSTKKSPPNKLNASSYELRDTPMRVLQLNGKTPMRESRSLRKFSSKKKRKIYKLNAHERVFDMQLLGEALDGANEYPDNVIEECIENVVIYENAPQIEEINVLGYENAPQIKENGNEFDGENAPKNGKTIVEPLVLTPVPSNVVNGYVPPLNRLSFTVDTSVKKKVKIISPLTSAKEQTNRKAIRVTPKVSSVSKKYQTSVAKVKSNRQSFMSALKSTIERSQVNYKSMAEMVREFEMSRSCSKPKQDDNKGQRSRSSSLTRPVSPKLMTRQRVHSERNVKDLVKDDIKKYTFKANPVNKRLFEPKFGAAGIPKVKSGKALTKPIEVMFHTQLRIDCRKNKK